MYRKSQGIYYCALSCVNLLNEQRLTKQLVTNAREPCYHVTCPAFRIRP